MGCIETKVKHGKKTKTKIKRRYYKGKDQDQALDEDQNQAASQDSVMTKHG